MLPKYVNCPLQPITHTCRHLRHMEMVFKTQTWGHKTDEGEYSRLSQCWAGPLIKCRVWWLAKATQAADMPKLAIKWLDAENPLAQGAFLPLKIEKRRVRGSTNPCSWRGFGESLFQWVDFPRPAAPCSEASLWAATHCTSCAQFLTLDFSTLCVCVCVCECKNVTILLAHFFLHNLQ